MKESNFKSRKTSRVKLMITRVSEMNQHFQPYLDLASPHSSSPENNSYSSIIGNRIDDGSVDGNSTLNESNNNSVDNSSIIGSNSNNSSGNNNNNNNDVMHHRNEHHSQQMSIDVSQPNFHQLNNNSSPIKHCAGCGGKIVERFFLHALDRFWHNSCLKCYCCGAMLADIGTSCFTKSGMILCKSDYSRMFGTASCSSCGQTIAANEFVMKTTPPNVNNQQQQQQQQQIPSSPPTGHRYHHQQLSSILENYHQKTFYPNQAEHQVFHLKCFTCSKCASQLRPGDRYYMLAGSLVCEQDWHKLLKNSSPSTPVRKGKVGRPRRSKE